MLLDLLARYLSHVEGEVRHLKDAYVERYEEEILANRVNLRVRVRFSNGFMLELNEAVIARGPTLTPWLSVSFSRQAK